MVGGTRILIPGRSSADQTYYQKAKERKRFRRRAGIEPVIGHLKNDHRMRRNFLAGELGDAVNCLLAGAAFNLKMRLNQLRGILGSIWAVLRAWIATQVRLMVPNGVIYQSDNPMKAIT